MPSKPSSSSSSPPPTAPATEKEEEDTQSLSPTLAETERYWAHEWHQICNRVAALGPTGAFLSNHLLRRITIQAPVLIGFGFLCTAVHIATGWSTYLQRALSVHDTFQASRWPLQYTSLVTHIFVHSSWAHLRGNMTNLLLVGPSVEHTFGSTNLLVVIGLVALVTAFVHIVVGSTHTHQLGASGVVFACILLSSLVSVRHGKIPLAFLLVTAMYMGEELALFFNFWNPKGVSHHAHLSGGFVGAMAGFYFHHQMTGEKTKKIIGKWKSSTRGVAGGANNKNTKKSK